MNHNSSRQLKKKNPRKNEKTTLNVINQLILIPHLRGLSLSGISPPVAIEQEGTDTKREEDHPEALD